MLFLIHGLTARSFGGLRMTEKVRGLTSRDISPSIVILRPPKDLAVLPFARAFANIG